MSTTLLAAEELGAVAAEDKVAVASQLQLTWWRFRRHRLAVWSGVIVVLFYLVAMFADFLATIDPHDTDAKRSFIPPQAIHWFDNGRFAPHVYGLKGVRDPRTFKVVYTPDPNEKRFLGLFVRDYGYNLLGLFPTERHLLGVTDGRPQDGLFLLGTDLLGRDVWSRLLLASRTSLTIGLAGVALSLFLGVLLGGISGLYGGWIDVVIQRVIEILRSIPTIPLWMGLAAALPSTWSVIQVYLAITVIISLIGWTELARVVRGRFLAMREEDFITAAELAGRQPDADHLPPHGPVVPEPHHRRGQPGAAGHDHQRDHALLSRAWPAPASNLLGRAVAGRAEPTGAGRRPLAAGHRGAGHHRHPRL